MRVVTDVHISSHNFCNSSLKENRQKCNFFLQTNINIKILLLGHRHIKQQVETGDF